MTWNKYILFAKYPIPTYTYTHCIGGDDSRLARNPSLPQHRGPLWARGDQTTWQPPGKFFFIFIIYMYIYIYNGLDVKKWRALIVKHSPCTCGNWLSQKVFELIFSSVGEVPGDGWEGRFQRSVLHEVHPSIIIKNNWGFFMFFLKHLRIFK